ncbi:aspartate/glutamate racemase family protein [Ramlibacter monticola]|uniref:Asp/Glu racemase n=1 Tax=Ramlibacter monticola TaxID=1926872 RepID=A0A936Z291_9BURK|nr:aspartate/glutamate racemase family protein [Ramlibacter monticola]MBL0392486.1 Asp/Glu racemase [Ramlibacter monticola]
MRELLVINPNTSEGITRLLRGHVQASLGAGIRVRAVTAPFGAPYISGEASCAVAGHAVLEAWQAARVEAAAPPAAVLLGCFGDPGLFALREICGVPVGGLADASFCEAARLGRFAVVTGGARWKPMLDRLAQGLGYAGALAGVYTVAASGPELAAEPRAAHALLAQACRDAARQSGASIVVLGGAALAGMADSLQPAFDGILIDSVAAGARWAAAAVQAGTKAGDAT